LTLATTTTTNPIILLPTPRNADGGEAGMFRKSGHGGNVEEVHAAMVANDEQLLKDMHAM